MKKQLILLSMTMASLAACQWDSPVTKQTHDINTDTLTFKYDTLKQRAADCGNKPDSTCTVANIIYPVFEGQKALNDSIAKKIIMAGFNTPDKKPDTSLQQYVAGFIKSYEADDTKASRPEMFYTLDMKAQVLRQDSSLTTLQIDGYIYLGGAHGGSPTSFINWNTKKGQSITLKDILVDGFDKKLTAVADTIFRQQEKLGINESLKDNYFFNNDKFALAQNYVITPMGIKFVYLEYEIKPYAAGKTELDVPYSKIKTLLRPNTVVTQYIK